MVALVVTDRDQTISAAFSQGQTAWPGTTLTHAAFAAYVATLDLAAISKYGDDLFLACACVTGDSQAIAAFEQHILSAAQVAVRAIDTSSEFVQEATQRVRTALLVAEPGQIPKIGTYAGRGPLRALIGVTAARTALMMKRSAARAKDGPDDNWERALSAATTGNPELDLLKRQHAALFSEALRHAAHALEPRMRAALRMHFTDGLSIDEIGVAYAVHRATAARWIVKAKEDLYTGTRAYLAAKLAMSETEFARMSALVQSQLDVSLSQLFTSKAPDKP